MTGYDDHLVNDLARVYAIAWECHDLGPTATFEPAIDDDDRAGIVAVLDRLIALGWSAPKTPSGIVVNVTERPPDVRYVPVPVIAEGWIRR